MSIGSLYTLTEVRQMTGENPNLLTYLLQDRQIPHKVVGMCKLVDDDGLAQLKEALADYHSKAPAAQAASA